jgi:HEAT repeat protein
MNRLLADLGRALRCFDGRCSLALGVALIVAPSLGLGASGASLPASSSGGAQATSEQREAAALVEELRAIPTPLPAIARSDGSVSPVEARRESIYRRLRELRAPGAIALERALHDPEAPMRRSAALALLMVGAAFLRPSQPALDLRVCLPGLTKALGDPDVSVRSWVAQAIGLIGADAAPAIPALIRLLSDELEGPRGAACMALSGIGPAAKDALPALRTALSDPSYQVRQVAQRAIAKIEQRQ